MQRGGADKDAGATACGFLGAGKVRRRVGADEEAAVARCHRLAQRQTMVLALGDRQAIEMRPQPALKDRGPVDDEMMRRNRSRDAGRMRAYDLDRFPGRDVLDDDLQAGVIPQQRQQALFHEHGLAVEHVDGRIGRLAVDQHGHADPLHPLEHRPQSLDIGHAMMRVGGGAGRIEFCGDPHLFGIALFDLVGRCRIGQVAGHQRLEIAAGGARGQDAVSVSGGGGHGGHRRHQVRHDDSAGELPGRERQHRTQHRAVAQMHVPVVGTTDGDAIDRLLARGRRSVEKTIQAHNAASASTSRITATPAMKSAIAMSSRGLCEPCSFRIKIIALGIPALANTAASCPAPLGIGSSGKPSLRAAVRNFSTHAGSMMAGADCKRRSSWNSTPRSSSMLAHSETKRS